MKCNENSISTFRKCIGSSGMYRVGVESRRIREETKGREVVCCFPFQPSVQNKTSSSTEVAHHSKVQVGRLNSPVYLLLVVSTVNRECLYFSCSGERVSRNSATTGYKVVVFSFDLGRVQGSLRCLGNNAL